MSDILDAATVRALLDYDPATGIFRWAVKTSNRRAGTLAGTLGRDGYVIICIKKRTYRAHRLAWLHITGSWPEDQIDHKNRVRNDNRLFNLRDCSGTVNQHNSGLRSDNKSGLRGVRYNQKRQKWEVRMKLHGKLIHIGRFADQGSAAAAYNATRAAHGLRPVDMDAASGDGCTANPDDPVVEAAE